MPTLSIAPAPSRSAGDWRSVFNPVPQFPPAGRALVVFAHPDDETVGLGATLSAMSDAWFVCVTDGAPRDMADAWHAGCSTRIAYAMRRQAELHAALGRAGHSPTRLSLLGVVDQEATFWLREIAVALLVKIDEVRPDFVVTHPYEGGHPDHDATCFAVHLACRSRWALGQSAPVVLEMTSYHSDAGAMRFGEFLGSATEELEIPLDDAARGRKQGLIECYPSQTEVLKPVPLDAECFRIAPAYDFTQAPHPGRLLYEQFPWGMDGHNWRRHAAAAVAGGLPAPGRSRSV